MSHSTIRKTNKGTICDSNCAASRSFWTGIPSFYCKLVTVLRIGDILSLIFAVKLPFASVQFDQWTLFLKKITLIVSPMRSGSRLSH